MTTWQAIPPWQYSATRSLQREIGAPVSHGSASLAFPQARLKSNWTCMGLYQTTSERNGTACTIIGRAARSDPWGVVSYATAVYQTFDSQYAEESGSSYCGKWWLHTLLTVIVLSLLSFCLFICHYVISLWFYPYICLLRSISWLLNTVIVHTDLVFTFCLIACVTVPAVQKVGISGPWGWVLWKTSITQQACPFLSNFAEISQNTYLSHCQFWWWNSMCNMGCNMHLHEKYQLQ